MDLSLHTHFTGGGIPFVCGGVIREEDVNTDLCYQYDAALDTWEISGTMAVTRAFSGYGSSENWGLVMAGGSRGEPYLSSVETTDNGQVFDSLPDLPEDNALSCLVILNDDILFTCGGNPLSPSDSTYIFYKRTNVWSRQVNLIEIGK